jgi:putative Holliday junction resolvase
VSDGRVVALDPGAARIGVAVSDAGRRLAFPRAAVAAGAGEVERCAAVVRDEDAVLVVVGHPLRLDGGPGEAAVRAEALASALRGALRDVPVVLHDERLTTVTATSRLRDAGVTARDAKDRVDGAAAVVLLESWLAT